jgi:PAS domain S-box-containing protein
LSDGLSGDEYTVLVEQAPMLIWRAGRSGECDYFNERWLAFRGRTLRQEAGNGWAEGVHPEDMERCLKTYLAAFARREVFEMEYRLMRYDGAYRWIFDRGSPFFEHGEFGGYIGSCVDVTDRVEAQDAMVRRRIAEISELQAVLPICSYCQQIRDEYGTWKAIEEYVAERSMMEFSHTICPGCSNNARKG